jgi:hypothetical protein
MGGKKEYTKIETNQMMKEWLAEMLTVPQKIKITRTGRKKANKCNLPR